MNVTINSRSYFLDKSLVIGTGGEATVYDLSSLVKAPFPQVAKIYHQPTAKRAGKIQDLIQANVSLPETVIYPLSLVYGTTSRSAVLGFTMRKLDPGNEPLASLMKRNFRAANNVTTKDVAGVFLNGFDTLAAIHQARLVVGDLNDQNEMFNLLKLLVFYLDVDSFQFGAYPCMVGTEEYLCPDLYGVDLSRRPAFRVEYDWYSFLVLLFRSLVGVHPYGGIHPKIPTLTKRSVERVPVWDSVVTPPKVALSFDFIDDGLMQVFERVFIRGERFILQKQTIEDYSGSLIECSRCRAWYPRQRRTCPGCSAKTVMVMQVKKAVAGVKSEEVIVTTGRIIFYKVLGETIFCLANERGQVVIYAKKPGQPISRQGLFSYRRGARYEIFAHYLVVCPDPVLEQLEIYDPTNPGQALLRTTTEVFGGGHAVFAGSREHLYRIAGATLLKGDIQFGNQLVERSAATTMKNQTWLVVSPNNRTGDEMVLGFHRVIKDYFYFLVIGGSHFDIAVSALEEGERLLETSVRFASDSVLLLRRTRKNGVDLVRIETIGRDGKVVVSIRQEAKQLPLYANLHGKAYAHGVVLHPTDDGIVQERLADQRQTRLDATAAYIDAGDALVSFGDGLLVVKEDRLLLLTMGK